MTSIITRAQHAPRQPGLLKFQWKLTFHISSGADVRLGSLLLYLAVFRLIVGFVSMSAMNICYDLQKNC